MKGFFNKIIRVNLTEGSYHEEHIPDNLYKRYLGGKGLATHLLLAHLSPNTDPLSPENVLIFAIGPVTDSKIFGSCRYGVFTKSPLTGYYSESYAGGKAAEPISRTGYDAVILHGAAPYPTLLEISDTGVVFHDAGDMWGLDAYEAEEVALDRVKTSQRKAALVIGPGMEPEFIDDGKLFTEHLRLSDNDYRLNNSVYTCGDVITVISHLFII